MVGAYPKDDRHDQAPAEGHAVNLRREKFQDLNLKFGSEIEKKEGRLILCLEKNTDDIYERSFWHLDNLRQTEDNTDLTYDKPGLCRKVLRIRNPKLLNEIEKRGFVIIEAEGYIPDEDTCPF